MKVRRWDVYLEYIETEEHFPYLATAFEARPEELGEVGSLAVVQGYSSVSVGEAFTNLKEAMDRWGLMNEPALQIRRVYDPQGLATA